MNGVQAVCQVKGKPAKPSLRGYGQAELRMKPPRHAAVGPDKKTVTFQTLARLGSRVFVAGTFNDWNPSSHPLEYRAEDGVFQTTLLLAPGYYEYKFVIDGLWHIDCSCPNWVLNPSGGLNSVLTV